MGGLLGQGYSGDQASRLMLSAMRAYCPEKLGGTPLG
jgi:hypothetical protein